MNQFHELLKKARVSGIPTPSSVEDCLACEKRLGLSFPQSYVDYVAVFGSGFWMGSCLLIQAPLADVDGKANHLEGMLKATRGLLAFDDSFDVTRGGKYFPFGCNEYSDYLCWKRAPNSRPREELDIYIISRERHETEWRELKCAENLFEFINDVWMGNGLRKIDENLSEWYEPEASYTSVR